MNLIGPDFICIGAQKCGTTSLYQYLSQHPQIIPAAMKEVHYFDLNYIRGDEWYNGFFPTWKKKLSLMIQKRKRMITGEASPYYIFHPHSLERIYKYNSNVKIIVLLRDPVERMWSHFRYAKVRGKEYLNFSEALEREDSRIKDEYEKMMQNENYRSFEHQRHSYRKRSEYYHQVEEVFKFFDRKNVLLLKSEDLFCDTQRIMDEVCVFLKVQKIDSDEYRIANKGGLKESIDPVIEKKMREYFKPYNEKLYDLTGRNFGW